MNKQDVIKVFSAWKDIMAVNKDYLIKIDGIVGDSDLGLTMSDGFAAAYEVVNETDETDMGKIFYLAGKKMSTAVPSTMGTLMASGLMNAGKELRGKTKLSNKDVASFFEAYFDGVANRGGAKIGDKTFLDGLHPAVVVLKELASEDVSLVEIAEKAKNAAAKGFESTKGMKAVHGRAAGRGEASIEILDPGAAVAKLLMEGFYNSLIDAK